MELIAAKHRFIVLVQQMLSTIRTVKSLEPHYRETLDRVREAWSRRVREATKGEPHADLGADAVART